MSLRYISLLTAAAIGFAVVGVAQEPVVKAFHPAGPLPSYEVATIKPADPARQFSGTTLRRYIAMAYGVPIPWGMPGVEFQNTRVVGGPEWIDKDRYDIHGKPPEEIREAMKKMSSEERDAQTEMMQQSLLADRFHLKVHFETREMPIFELVPAKGGLKITPVNPPPDMHPTMTPPKPGEPPPPGMTRLSVRTDGVSILDARSTTIEQFTNALRGQSPDIAGRPIVDRTGFKDHFDVNDFRFLGQAPPQAGPGSNSDSETTSVAQALEHQLV